MSVEVTIIFSLITLIIAIVSFFIGQKKSSKEDGMSLGAFMGEVKADLSSIKTTLTELKNKNDEVGNMIKEAVAEHVKVYHNK